MKEPNEVKRIIIKPLISERTIAGVDTMNKYTFIVERHSTKVEVAKEVEKLFAVKVLRVTTMNYTGKIVRFGKKRIEGRRDAFKKAIVTLKKGDKISIFDVK